MLFPTIMIPGRNLKEFKGPFGWRSRKVGGWKIFNFPLVCLVGGVEKWKGGKLFCLVGEKKGRMENVIYIN